MKKMKQGWRINMAGNKVIAVDLGGTNLRVAVVKNGRITEILSKKTPKQGNYLLKELIDSIETLMIKEKGIKGVGIASPGPLKEGVIKNPPNLPLQNFNLKKFLEKKLGTRVEIENDANCVALAEAKIGVKKENFIVLTLGTGIGGGIIIDNELFIGKGYAGEFGHMIIDKGEWFETLAAWNGLKKLTMKNFGRTLLVKDLFAMKTPRAAKVLGEIVDYLGRGIGSLINIFNPEVVVLSGGMRENGQKLLSMIKKASEKYSILPEKTDIRWSRLSNAGILGASLLLR
jgi:predicted NBD/HSP70 family sugar kinase